MEIPKRNSGATRGSEMNERETCLLLPEKRSRSRLRTNFSPIFLYPLKTIVIHANDELLFVNSAVQFVGVNPNFANISVRSKACHHARTFVICRCNASGIHHRHHEEEAKC